MTRAAERAVLIDHIVLREALETHAMFTKMASDLVFLIEGTEHLVGCHDPAHPNYPRECTSGRVRLNAIHKSIDDLEIEIAVLHKRGTGLCMAGRDRIPVERQFDGAGVETLWSDGE
jgi:hypothetical protein